MTVEVQIDDRRVTLDFSKAQVHLGGDTAGHIELNVRCNPPVSPSVIEEHLWLQEPGEVWPLSVQSCRETDDGIYVRFFSGDVSNASNPPASLRVLWKDGKSETDLGELDFENRV